MNKEQIRKAAENYAVKIRKELAFHIYAPYQVEDYVQEAFDDGAEWCINSVWHDARKEIPERKRKYLAQCKNGRFNALPDSMDWDNFYKKAEIIRWAYIEDLLPNTDR